MDPPNRQVGGAGAGVRHTRKPPGNHQPDRRAVRRDAGGLLPNDSQSFCQIAGDANGQEGEDHIPVRGPMADAGWTPRATPKEQQAPGQEQQSKNIERELVNDVVGSLVEFERL